MNLFNVNISFLGGYHIKTNDTNVNNGSLLATQLPSALGAEAGRGPRWRRQGLRQRRAALLGAPGPLAKDAAADESHDGGEIWGWYPLVPRWRHIATVMMVVDANGTCSIYRFI